MTVIDRIKEDLRKISKWPWGWKYAVKSGPCALSGEEGQTDVLIPTQDADDYCFIDISEVHKSFIAHSPERIALLVEYYEAAEEWIRGDWNSEKPEVVNAKMAALDKARAKLEKEEP